MKNKAEAAEFEEKYLGMEYFDVKSQHCLMPLMEVTNSYNRNFVLSFGHGGVRAIIERVGER